MFSLRIDEVSCYTLFLTFSFERRKKKNALSKHYNSLATCWPHVLKGFVFILTVLFIWESDEIYNDLHLKPAFFLAR